MTRAQQIEELGRVWESLGDGRESWWHPKRMDGATYSALYFGYEGRPLRDAIEIKAEGTDTDDATPCLAILRDVFGDDWTINEHGTKTQRWWCPNAIGRKFTFVKSELSRIDAVKKALEAK